MNAQNPNMDDFFRNLFGSGSEQNNHNTPNPFDLLGGLLGGGAGGQSMPMPTGGVDFLGMLENILNESMKGANRSTQSPISEDEVKKFSEQIKDLDNEKVEDILRNHSSNNNNAMSDFEAMLNAMIRPSSPQGEKASMQDQMREQAKKNHPSQGGRVKPQDRIVTARVTHREGTTHVEVVTQGVSPEQLTSVSLDEKSRLVLTIEQKNNSSVNDGRFFTSKVNETKNGVTINLNTPEGTVLVEEGSSYTFEDGVLNITLNRKSSSFVISEKNKVEDSIVEDSAPSNDGTDGFFAL